MAVFYRRRSFLCLACKLAGLLLAVFIASSGGAVHTAGGKTGTGDHRYFGYGKNGSVVESRVVSRAATFVFMLDDRYFGTVTAYVPGPEAARFHFTSALPVRIAGLLMPALDRLAAAPAPDRLRAAAR